MPRKTDSPAKRRREARFKGPKVALQSHVQGLSSEQLDNYWKVYARVALSVEDTKDVSVDGMTIQFRPSVHIDYFASARRRLFDHFGFDPNDPWHWRQLVDFFAYIEFWEGPRRKPGRPREDRSAKDADVAAAIAALPSYSNTKLALRLARTKGSPLFGKKRSARTDVARVKKSLSKAGT
jgi:hypothetical protein